MVTLYVNYLNVFTYKVNTNCRAHSLFNVEVGKAKKYDCLSLMIMSGLQVELLVLLRRRLSV